MLNWQQNFENVTWNEYIDLSFNLSQKINQSFDLIIAIARGGLTLSQLLSDALSLPIASFTIESYKNLKQENIPHITHGLSSSLLKKKILLVDDICDTGKTFIRGLSYLEELGAEKKNITTCSLFLKPRAKFKPDFYITVTSKWVIYPYEVKETIKALLPIWQKENLTSSQIKHRFLSLHFPENQINRYL